MALMSWAIPSDRDELSDNLLLHNQLAEFAGFLASAGAETILPSIKVVSVNHDRSVTIHHYWPLWRDRL